MSEIKSDITLLWEPGVDRSHEIIENSDVKTYRVLTEDPHIVIAARKELERIAKARREDPTWAKQRKYEDRIEFITEKMVILEGKLGRLKKERKSKRRVLRKLQQDFLDSLAKEQLEKG